jgi:5-formyltetrahydrofolate cyclo-ligase
VTKPEARSVYLKKRMALSANEIETASKIFFDLLCSSFELTAIRVIHTYLPLALKNEPNTWLIINGLRSRFPSIKISIPKMEGNRLINYYFENRAQLSINAWGIEEPTSGELTPTEKIDVVLVPLLAFDKTGNRVGYGKGYYDRFLKECRSGCKKIGFSFFEPVDEISDADTHDIKLTHSITPKKIYTF